VSILWNAPKHGGIKNVRTVWLTIDPPRQLKTGESSKKTKHIFFNDKIQDKKSQTMSVVMTTSLRVTNRPPIL